MRFAEEYIKESYRIQSVVSERTEILKRVLFGNYHIRALPGGQ